MSEIGELALESERAFRTGELRAILRFRCHFLDHVIKELQRISRGPSRAVAASIEELSWLHLYFEDQRDDIAAEPYNRLGGEIVNFLLLLPMRPVAASLSAARQIRRRLRAS